MKSRVLEPFHLLIILCLLFLITQKTHSQAITGLTAGFVNASTLNVSWDAVSPSEKVSGYDVIVLEETTALRRIGVDNITSSIETSSLDQCRNYTVKVAANSTVGSGNYSTLDLVTKCVPPSIEHQPRVYVIARQDARFPCDYRGFPTPSVYWTVTYLSLPKNVTEGGEKFSFNDIVDDIPVSRELKVTPNGSLVIPQVLHSDSMVQFQCTAVNRLGVAKVDVYLTVVKEYATVNFRITFVWTNTLNEHNQNGTFGEFFHKQFKALNVSSLHDVSIICPHDICAIVEVNSNTKGMVLSLTAAVTEGEATDSIEKEIVKIADSKAIGLLTLKNVIIMDLAPPAPVNRRVDENSKKPKEVVIRWDTPPHADVYELSSYSVEKKPLLDYNAPFQSEKTLDAEFTELKMTGLKPDTAYVVKVKSHRKNSQKTGETQLEFTTPKDHTLTIALAVVIPLIAIIIVVLVLLVIKFRKIPRPAENERRLTMDDLQRRDRRTYGPQDSDDNIYQARGDRIVALSETDFVRKWPEIPRELLKLAEELGSGAFGLVRKGYLMRNNKVIECAVKMLKRHGTVTELRDLYNELNIMASVGNHPNIVSLIGACSEDGPLWVVVKFAENGSLLEYIRKHKKQPDYINTMTDESISNIEILQLAHGIAKGMNHLAKVKCVHRDLACRNVLLGKKFIPMVGDFGLARDIYESGAYETTSGGKLPVRWMALESLQDYSYTSESDVWSFGVVLWEIETGGKVPYAALGGHEIVEALKRGERLPKPEGCTNELYDIMLKCWHANPQQRLTFEELVHVVDSLMTAEADYLEIIHDNPTEAEDDTPYDEIRFDKIPEDYFWPSELRIHHPLESRSGLVTEPRGDTANGQVAPHAHERDINDTGF